MDKPKGLKTEYWDIEQLIPYENNAKNHPKEQIKKLASSMKEFGFPDNKAIEVDTNGVIINGHGRRLGAMEANLLKVPVVVRHDLTDAQIKKYRLIDNKVAESTYDTDLMSAEMIDILESGENLDIYFDERDLQFLTDDLGEIDSDALAMGLNGEFDDHAEATQEAIKEQDEKMFHISSVLGFKEVTGEQQRKLLLFMTHVEAVTSMTGADALIAFSRDFVGIK